jgi:hypothetical protein
MKIGIGYALAVSTGQRRTVHIVRDTPEGWRSLCSLMREAIPCAIAEGELCDRCRLKAREANVSRPELALWRER